MKASDRVVLMDAYPDVPMSPDQNLAWVWFGEYRRPRFHPFYLGHMVQRYLFEHFTGQKLGKKRLRVQFSQFYSDVNPFLCLPTSTNATHNARKTQGRRDATTKMVDGNFRMHVHDCVMKIKSGGYETFEDGEIRTFMVHEGFYPGVIEEAIKQLRSQK